MRANLFLLCGSLTLLAPVVSEAAATSPAATANDCIHISGDGKRFFLPGPEGEFTPWGFNYDHDRSNRLLEEYWVSEWESVRSDFKEMKALGANTVRVHLQVASFMKSARETNRVSLDQLTKLLEVARDTGLYLDITGLGCYNRKDVPPWYKALNEQERWEVQARFWDAVAEVCASSPRVFCYDLMNEPIVTEDKEKREWTPGEFAGKCFVQRLTVDFAGRTQEEIAKAWVDKMVAAIRRRDPHRLITVGAIPWAHVWPTAKPLFYSPTVGKNLDFVSLHFYPKKGEVDKALAALKVYSAGKPIVIEEMFPLSCSVTELDEFVEGSRQIATGWIGFYWGKTIPEYREGKRDIAEGMALDWLEYFVRKTPSMVKR